MLEQLTFAFGITGPILFLLGLGRALRQISLIDTEFVSQANALVFNVALPAMLLVSISRRDIGDVVDVRLTLVGLGGTLLLVGILLLIGRLLPSSQRGVFVQGSYRGNLAILGVALAVATYGEDVLPRIALYIAVVTTAYNILAVWVLNSDGILKSLLTNPILIGIALGTLLSLSPLSLPIWVMASGDYLTSLALPLALICIGATLDFSSLIDHSRSLALAAFFKLIVSPVLLVGIGILAGLEAEQLGILFYLAASPTATASYIMARQLTEHGQLAGEIVAVTTALGIVTYTIGIAALKSAGLV